VLLQEQGLPKELESPWILPETNIQLAYMEVLHNLAYSFLEPKFYNKKLIDVNLLI
jgi:hypothetical protein